MGLHILRWIEYIFLICLVVGPLGSACRADTKFKEQRLASKKEAVTCSVVNLRAGPGVGYNKKAVMASGETVSLLARTTQTETIEAKSDFWYQIKRKNGETGWLFGAYLNITDGMTKTPEAAVSPPHIPPLPPQNEKGVQVFSPVSPQDVSNSPMRPLNSTLLEQLLTARGFEIPDTFKALIIEIVRDKSGAYVYYPMDLNMTSLDRDDWWPASTVKLYAAVAALEKLRAMGFSPKAELTFQYEESPVTQSMQTLVNRALVDSKNAEFDRLVEFVGSKRLNRYFLVAKKGIQNTVMTRCYSGRVLHPELGKCSNRHSPPIQIVENKHIKTLVEKFNTDVYDCDREGNCTTLRDLTEVLRRVMMHEYLPKSMRYKLGEKEMSLLRGALHKKAKGGVNDGIRTVFEGRPFEIYHKGGYADQWFSDNVFLRINDTGEQWIIALVNRPGRESLNEAALHVASLIADGTLSRERKKAFSKKDKK